MGMYDWAISGIIKQGKKLGASNAHTRALIKHELGVDISPLEIKGYEKDEN